MDTLLSFLNQKNNLIRAVRLEPQLGGYNHRPAERFSAIHISAMYGLRHVTRRLLDEGVSAASRDSCGRTPLFLAAMTGEMGVVELLAARDDVDINTQTDSPYSLTPLYVAADGSHHEVVRLLLQGGADVNLRSWHGTALNCAVRSRNASSVELLLEAGADPDTRDEKDTPVILEAARVSETNDSCPTAQFVKLLHKYGAKLTARDASQSTLLHVAAEACNLDVVQMLLGEGFDSEAVNDMGQTPLHKALDCLPPPYSKSAKERIEFDARHSAIVRLLVENKSYFDSEGHLALAPLFMESSEQLRSLVDGEVDPKGLMHEGHAASEPLNELKVNVELPWSHRPYPGLDFLSEKTIHAQSGLFELE